MLSRWARKSPQFFSQTHMFNVCALCTMKRKGWLGSGECRVGGEVVVGGGVWQEKPSNRISVWKCAQYPTGQLSTLSKQDNLTSHSNVLWRLDNIFSMHVTRAEEKRKRYLLTCRARLYARVSGTAAGIKWTRVLLRQWLEKEGTCQTLTAKGYILCKAVGCAWMEFSFQLTRVRWILGGKMWEFLLISTQAMPFVRHQSSIHWCHIYFLTH